MISKQYIQNQSFVFNRWSRKSWSLFSALGKHITIGVLSTNICNMAYQKLMVIGSYISTFYNSFFTLNPQSFMFDLGQQTFIISNFSNSTNQVTLIDSIDIFLNNQKLKSKVFHS